MSRKRKLKKQDKRLREWVTELEDLYLRGEDEAFLEAARPHFGELASSPIAGIYTEVADRTLAAAVNDGDPDKIAKVLARLRRSEQHRPLVALAEAVTWVADGRCEAALERLDALEGAGAEADLPLDRGQLALLRSLAAGQPSGRSASTRFGSLGRDVDGLARLTAVLVAHAEGASELPRSLKLHHPGQVAIWGLVRALAATKKNNYAPNPKTLAALRRAVAAVRGSVDAQGSLERLLRETEKRLEAMVSLREIEKSLRRDRRHGPAAEELLLERLRSLGHRLTKLLHAQPPPILGALHQALRSKWRELLELVSQRRGEVGLANLLAARNDVFAPDLETPSGSAELAQWAELRSLIESGRFREVGALLRQSGRRSASSERLASEWSLELWALGEAAFPASPSAPATFDPHDLLMRVLEMAGEVGRRFDEEQRPGVARFLRDDLFELCHGHYVCDHSQAAAERLLEFLPGDAGLLVVALAGAVCSEDEKAAREIEARIKEQGEARPGGEALVALAFDIAAEEFENALRILSAIRPLFSTAGWDLALDRVAPVVLKTLDMMLFEAAETLLDDAGEAHWILDEARRDLDRCRPLLGERFEFLALQVAIACFGAKPADIVAQSHRFLQRFPDLQPALTLYSQAFGQSSADVSPGFYALAAEAVFARLDARWRSWLPYLGPLVRKASAKQIRELRGRIRGFIEDESLADRDREALLEIEEEIDELLAMKKSRPRLKQRRPARRKVPNDPPSRPAKPRARSRRDDTAPDDASPADLQLSLFDLF